MKTTKEELQIIDRFYLADPNDLKSLDDWAVYLESILNGNCTVMEINGKLELLLIKALVASIRGMKIEIFPKEHAPPHFHVKSADIDASFSINDCSLLHGKIDHMDYDKILYWYNSGAKQILVEKWNLTRPSKCIVGPISKY